MEKRFKVAFWFLFGRGRWFGESIHGQPGALAKWKTMLQKVHIFRRLNKLTSLQRGSDRTDKVFLVAGQQANLLAKERLERNKSLNGGTGAKERAVH